MRNYYAILGILPSATKEEIRRAYHKLAKLYHPDVNQNNKTKEEILKEINDAYAILLDDETREKFDLKYKQHLDWEKQMKDYEDAVRQLKLRKTYLINFDPEFLKDLFSNNLPNFHAALIRDPGILEWLHFSSYSYLIVVNKNLSASHISAFVRQNMPGKNHLVIEVNVNNHDGWLPKTVWDWINRHKLPTPVPSIV
jgi:curved DNA-binding protein CbpA